MSERIHWQLPRDRLLIVTYGHTQQLVVEGRCLAQGSAGFVIEATPGHDAFAGLNVREQFIPYSSVIDVQVLGSAGGHGHARRVQEQETRKDRVRGELEGLLEGQRQHTEECAEDSRDDDHQDGRAAADGEPEP